MGGESEEMKGGKNTERKNKRKEGRNVKKGAKKEMPSKKVNRGQWKRNILENRE